MHKNYLEERSDLLSSRVFYEVSKVLDKLEVQYLRLFLVGVFFSEQRLTKESKGVVQSLGKSVVRENSINYFCVNC